MSNILHNSCLFSVDTYRVGGRCRMVEWWKIIKIDREDDVKDGGGWGGQT